MPMDQRRRVRWVNFMLAGILAGFGLDALFGAPSMFTRLLAAQGVDDEWGVIMVGLAMFHMAVSLTTLLPPGKYEFLRSSCRTLVLLNGGTAVVMVWTWLIVGVMGGLWTRTVWSCVWLSLSLALMTYFEAKASSKIRMSKEYLGYAGQ